MLMLDLCSGLGGASEAMKIRKWKVIRVDIDPKFSPDIVADLREFNYDGETPDLIWVSPPCLEFSRESMPWTRTGKNPDMSIVMAGKKIIENIKPEFWVIENVRGAIPYFQPFLGKYRLSAGPFFLWSNLPNSKIKLKGFQKKESYSSSDRELRAKIPYLLSNLIAEYVEKYSKQKLFI